MARAYSKLFYANQANVGPPGTVWTVAEGTVVVVRDIAVYNDHTAAQDVAVVTSPGSIVLFQSTALGVGSYDHWVGRQVLELGDALQVFCKAGPCRFRISGYLLQV